jgi:flagellar basal-body rod protein FlgB
MDLNGIPLFSLISGRMSWLSARQSVLAENVANGDTPNYVARDLKPLDFQNMLSGQEKSSTHLATTNVRHFDVRSGARGRHHHVIFYRTPVKAGWFPGNYSNQWTRGHAFL